MANYVQRHFCVYLLTKTKLNLCTKEHLMRFYALLLMLACTVLSCSKNDTTAPEIDAVIVPGVGSSFTYAGHEIDLSGAKVTGSDRQYLYTIAATGLTVRGQSGAWAAVRGGGSDTLFFAKDATNNVWLLIGGSEAGFPWMRLPLKANGVSMQSDTVMRDLGGLSVPFITTGKVSHKATEQVEVAGKTITTHKIEYELSVTISFMGQEQTETFGFTMWYAPSLGMHTRVETKAQQVDNSVENGDVESLVSYSLK